MLWPRTSGTWFRILSAICPVLSACCLTDFLLRRRHPNCFESALEGHLRRPIVSWSILMGRPISREEQHAQVSDDRRMSLRRSSF